MLVQKIRGDSHIPLSDIQQYELGGLGQQALETLHTGFAISGVKILMPICTFVGKMNFFAQTTCVSDLMFFFLVSPSESYSPHVIGFQGSSFSLCVILGYFDFG